MASFCIGKEVNEKEVLATYIDRIHIVDKETWFIPKFVHFQYGVLNPSVNCHKSVIAELKMERVTKQLTKGYSTLQDKDKDKDKDKVKANEDIDLIVTDLNCVLGTNYKTTSTKTADLISHHINDGFTVNDFKKVHRNMLLAWGADNKMIKYLRPETLYGPKFEGYLNQKTPTTKLTSQGVGAYFVGRTWLKEKGVANVE